MSYKKQILSSSAVLLILLSGFLSLKVYAGQNITRLENSRYQKIIGKRYEVISSDLYLLTPEKLYPYLTLVYIKPHAGHPTKNDIHIPKGSIFKIIYVAQTKYFASGTHTHYVAKLETPDIYEKEFRIDHSLMKLNNSLPGGFDVGKDEKFNERFIKMNPEFLKEIE